MYSVAPIIILTCLLSNTFVNISFLNGSTTFQCTVHLKLNLWIQAGLCQYFQFVSFTSSDSNRKSVVFAQVHNPSILPFQNHGIDNGWGEVWWGWCDSLLRLFATFSRFDFYTLITSARILRLGSHLSTSYQRLLIERNICKLLILRISSVSEFFFF